MELNLSLLAFKRKIRALAVCNYHANQNQNFGIWMTKNDNGKFDTNERSYHDRICGTYSVRVKIP